ncbi:hypothetical protein EC973_009233 [Apophysomyces ossiformis]|uniref:Glutamine amidotransferase type-2 domain-containing protein n=1 Tax=Apophysomyces ossiformis TaxID=679940 RepID=A0A8H7BRA7_9FUNG|nr:hypothetical protein EC973_009233 [Apophysomyces ossiformis]
MCGFSVYLHFDSSLQGSNGTGFPDLDLDASLNLINHRGPDDRGVYVTPDGRCGKVHLLVKLPCLNHVHVMPGMGHVRLSIIDLEGGHQPLSNKTETIHAVVNGELYDYERITEELKARGHEFKTKSDSEIAVHLYEEEGLSFVEQLRGEFAICIWDSKRQRLTAVRDRFGIKPLYYTVYNGTLLLASEIKAFLALGWKAEWDVDSITHNGCFCDYRTCFKGVYSLVPGHYLTATPRGKVEVRRYWDADYPDKTIPETRSVEEMIQGVRKHLVESVRHRLRADVPLGVYLSGGIDSAAMAGIATHILREKDPDAKVHAFSISFKDGGAFDEAPIAERTAAFCGAAFHKLSVSQDELVKAFEQSIWHTEIPNFNLGPAGKHLLSKLVRDNGYKVVLTGEGADEHFAGYNLFQPDYCRETDLASPEVLRLNDATRLRLLKGWESNGIDMVWTVLNTKDDDDTVTKKMVNGCTTHFVVGSVYSLSNHFYQKQLYSLFGEPNPPSAIANNLDGIARKKARTKWHPLHTALYLENHSMLPNYLCCGLGDRNEMAHSIEARTPFLDHCLCEYVNNLPPSVKVRGTEDGKLSEKWILKEAVKPFITEEIYTRKKRPYVPPPPKDTNTPVATLIQSKLTEENVKALGFIDWEVVDNCKREFFSRPSARTSRDLLILTSYVIIADKFRVPTWTNSVLTEAQR